VVGDAAELALALAPADLVGFGHIRKRGMLTACWVCLVGGVVVESWRHRQWHGE